MPATTEQYMQLDNLVIAMLDAGEADDSIVEHVESVCENYHEGEKEGE